MGRKGTPQPVLLPSCLSATRARSTTATVWRSYQPREDEAGCDAPSETFWKLASPPLSPLAYEHATPQKTSVSTCETPDASKKRPAGSGGGDWTATKGTASGHPLLHRRPRHAPATRARGRAPGHPRVRMKRAEAAACGRTACQPTYLCSTPLHGAPLVPRAPPASRAVPTRQCNERSGRGGGKLRRQGAGREHASLQSLRNQAAGKTHLGSEGRRGKNGGRTRHRT